MDNPRFTQIYQLYKKLKLINPNSPNYDTIKTNLKTYHLILKQNIHSAKQIYHETCFHLSEMTKEILGKQLMKYLQRIKQNSKLPTVF